MNWGGISKTGERDGDDSYTVRQLHVGVPGRFSYSTSPGAAVLIPAGSRLRLDVRYVPDGTPETDRTSVGLYFAHGTVDKQERNLHYQTKSIRIPARDPAYKIEGTLPMREPITVYQVACHMHSRGKSYRIQAELPDSRKIELMNVSHYSFGWQQMYILENPVHLPAGTIVRYTAIYDNSPDNNAVVHLDTPDRVVTWGQRTIDEMMGGHVLYTEDAEHLHLVIDPATGTPVAARATR